MAKSEKTQDDTDKKRSRMVGLNRAEEGRHRSWNEIGAVAILSVMILAVHFLSQQWVVRDWWKGLWFQPSEGVEAISDGLELTARGQRILKATQPMLESSEGFNSHCDSVKTEVSLLGCYKEGRIYVFEVSMPELVDSNKVTMAHELLHAAWARMGDEERAEVTDLLKQVQAENAEWFEAELSAYDEAERLEEVYTRAGTKLRNLPEKLEENYSKLFRNRQKIVAYYENYQAPFRRLQDENEALRTQIFKVKDEIEKERSEYLAQAGRLDAEVAEFNTCADTTGCFSSEEEFRTRRNELETKQRTLDQTRQLLNAKIDENNARVEVYQKNQQELGELSGAMNSKVEGV